MDEVRCLTVKQVAERLQVSQGVAYRLVRTGALPSIRVGATSRRVTTKQLDDFINGGGVAA